MQPRRILARQEAAKIIDHAVSQNALAVINVCDGGNWRTFKSRFLERDPKRKFFVLDCQETHGHAPPALSSGQYVGISFRSHSRKVLFASVVEAKGRYVVDGDKSMPAIRYRWPDAINELQRRAYYRTRVPSETIIGVNLWRGGIAARSQDAENCQVCAGHCLDLSCGGSLLALSGDAPTSWKDNDTIGMEIHLPDGRGPVLLDAYFRGIRKDVESGNCAALQFVGLELSPDGRSILQRLARCLQKLHRQAVKNELKAGQSDFGSN